MQGTIFIRILESEYRRMLSVANGEWQKNISSVTAYVSHNPEKAISSFKEWFQYALRTTEVQVGETVVKPEDLLVYAASKSSSIPPHMPTYPDVVKILSLFSDPELEEIFGTDRTPVLQKAIGRTI